MIAIDAQFTLLPARRRPRAGRSAFERIDIAEFNLVVTKDRRADLRYRAAVCLSSLT
jgi:hypothetical protein